MKKRTAAALALGNLKKRRKQYVTLIAGIILAMVFSSGTLFFVSCMSASVKEARRVDYTQASRIAFGAREEGLAELDAQKPNLEYGLAHIIGFGYTGDEEEGAAVAWLDDLAEELYYPVVLAGRLPEKAGEIAAEKDALVRMGLSDVAVGETVTLNVKTPDGGDWLPEISQKTYTLVGLLGDKRSHIELYSWHSPYAPALLVCDGEQTEIGGKDALTAYIRYAPEYDEKFWMNDTPGGCTTGSIDTGDSFDKIRLKTLFGATLAVALSLASALGVVNAFNSNLSERKKQIGLLRAVGATKRQIVRIYGRESFLLSLICAPVSLMISYFGVKIITGFMDQFYFLPSWYVLFGAVAVSVAFVLLASLIPLAAASRVSPMQAIRNTELSRKQKRMRIKSRKQFDVPKLLASRNLKFYRLRTTLTALILAVTIFISCYAFSFLLSSDVGWYAFDYRLSLSADIDHGIYANYIQDMIGYTENDKMALLQDPDVASVGGRANVNAVVSADEYSDYMRLLNYNYNYYIYDGNFSEHLTPQNYRGLDENLAAQWTAFKNALKLPEATTVLPIVARDEASLAGLSQYVVEGKLDFDKVNSGEEIILNAPNALQGTLLHFADDENKYYFELHEADDELRSSGDGQWTALETAERSFHVGDEITVTVVTGDTPEPAGGLPDNYTYTKKTVRIGAICTGGDLLNIRSGHSMANIVTTVDGLRKFTDRYKYESLDVTMKNEVTEEIDARMQSIIDRITSGVPSYVTSTYQTNQDIQRSARQGLIIVGAVVILMLSVAGSMINNALSARIREGRRELGTLRAVGASARELTGSYVRELLHMTGVGSAIGFAGFLLFWIGAGMAEWLRYHFTEKPVFEHISLWETLIGVALLFAVCAFNLWRQIRRQMKYSVVENIREL